VLGKAAALPTGALPTRDLAGILARCEQLDLGVMIDSRAKMAEFVDVGARWDCIRAVYAGANEGLAGLELGATFAADHGGFAVPPALLDIAPSFAIQSIGEGNYLPLSYA